MIVLARMINVYPAPTKLEFVSLPTTALNGMYDLGTIMGATAGIVAAESGLCSTTGPYLRHFGQI